MADAGARVIKIERETGDTARQYDRAVPEALLERGLTGQGTAIEIAMADLTDNPRFANNPTRGVNRVVLDAIIGPIFAAHMHGAPLQTFDYRGISPLTDGAAFTMNAAERDDGLHLWTAAADGRLCMEAQASWT